MIKGIMIYFVDGTFNRFELDDSEIKLFEEWLENDQKSSYRLIYNECTYYLFKNSIKYVELYK